MITHNDILDRLKGVPAHSLRWLVLKDELVDCDLQIRCLDQGSLDPLVVAIREALTQQQQMTLKDLCAAVGGCGSHGRRVVSEVLRVLERGKELRTKDQHMFIASDLARWTERTLSERIVEKRFRFLPRSCRFEPKINGITQKRIPNIKDEYRMDWCEFPNETLLYSEMVLSDAILKACREYYKNRAVKIYFEESDARLELLQRSWLMFADPRFIDASVLKTSKARRWLIHRCYLYKSPSWNCLVYSYPDGPEQKPYSDTLNRLICESSLTRDRLLAVSKEI